MDPAMLGVAVEDPSAKKLTQAVLGIAGCMALFSIIGAGLRYGAVEKDIGLHTAKVNCCYYECGRPQFPFDEPKFESYSGSCTCEASATDPTRCDSDSGHCSDSDSGLEVSASPSGTDGHIVMPVSAKYLDGSSAASTPPPVRSLTGDPTEPLCSLGDPKDQNNYDENACQRCLNDRVLATRGIGCGYNGDSVRCNYYATGSYTVVGEGAVRGVAIVFLLVCMVCAFLVPCCGYMGTKNRDKGLLSVFAGCTCVLAVLAGIGIGSTMIYYRDEQWPAIAVASIVFSIGWIVLAVSGCYTATQLSQHQYYLTGMPSVVPMYSAVVGQPVGNPDAYQPLAADQSTAEPAL